MSVPVIVDDDVLEVVTVDVIILDAEVAVVLDGTSKNIYVM